jgi:hypothetical protein
MTLRLKKTYRPPVNEHLRLIGNYFFEVNYAITLFSRLYNKRIKIKAAFAVVAPTNPHWARVADFGFFLCLRRPAFQQWRH